ncbi:MAG: hypothetical protein WEB00_13210 [Dehalococcoidia bacterium]
MPDLTRAQEALLRSMVEAYPSAPTQPFMLLSMSGGEILLHDGLADDLPINVGDLKALERRNFFNVTRGSKGTPNYRLDNLAFDYVAELDRQEGREPEKVEEEIVRYLDGRGFKQRHPGAYAKWAEAAELTASMAAADKETQIGHLCREAMQEFATELLIEYRGEAPSEEKALHIKRLKAALEEVRPALGKTKPKFLDALVDYWAALNDLVQRQEKGAVKEGESLEAEDSRRVVFHSAVLMFELDRTLNSEAAQRGWSKVVAGRLAAQTPV